MLCMLNNTTFALVDDVNPEEEIFLGDDCKQEEDEAAICFVFGILWSLSAILPLLGTILWMDGHPFNGTEALIKGLGHFMVITFIMMCSQMLAPLTMEMDEPLITPATEKDAPTIEPWYRVVMWSSVVLLLATLAGEVYILTLAEDWAAITLVVLSMVITASLLCLCCGAVCSMYDIQQKQQQVAKRVQAEGRLFFSSWHLSHDPLPFSLVDPARFVRRYNDAARKTPGIGSTMDAVMVDYASQAEHLSSYELEDKQCQARCKVWNLLEKHEAKTQKEGVTEA